MLFNVRSDNPAFVADVAPVPFPFIDLSLLSWQREVSPTENLLLYHLPRLGFCSHTMSCFGKLKKSNHHKLRKQWQIAKIS